MQLIPRHIQNYKSLFERKNANASNKKGEEWPSGLVVGGTKSRISVGLRTFTQKQFLFTCSNMIENNGFLKNNRPNDGAKVSNDYVSPYMGGNFDPTPNEGHWNKLNVEFLTNDKSELDAFRSIYGEFLRIGPNPRFDFKGYPYHPFDGDGFIHGVTFHNGNVSYTKRYVLTKRLVSSIKRGFDVSEFGEGALGKYGYFKYVADEKKERMGKANTNMIYHAGKLLALEEQDKPYAVNVSEDGEKNLQTIGRVDFDGKLSHVVTAHPKRDSKTGELIMFGYNVLQPQVDLSVVSPSGELLRTLEIPLPHQVMMHDFVITQHYSIMFDFNLQFHLDLYAEKKNPWIHRIDIPCRFGVIPRHATSPNEIRWFSVSPCAVFHFANAWEEKDGKIIKIVGARSNTVAFSVSDDKESGTARQDDTLPAILYMWTIDLSKTGGVIEERRISEHFCDFVQIDQERCGYKSDFIYGARMVPHQQFNSLPVKNKEGLFYVDGLLKYDMRTNQVIEHEYKTKAGNKGFGGEAVFARTSKDHEDSGVMVVVVHDEITEQSETQIINARTMKLIARINMPERVPYGFHSYFCPGEFLSPSGQSKAKL